MKIIVHYTSGALQTISNARKPMYIKDGTCGTILIQAGRHDHYIRESAVDNLELIKDVS